MSGHGLQVLDSEATAALVPAEQLIVQVCRGLGSSVHVCECGTLIAAESVAGVERMHADHLDAVVAVAR